MRAARIALYFLRRGWYLTVGSGRNVTLGVFAIAMALLLWGVVLLLQGNLARSLGGLGSDLKARAYLDPGAGREVVAAIIDLARNSGAVDAVRQVDPDTAAEELILAFPDLGAVAEPESGVVNGYVEWTWRPDAAEQNRSSLIGSVGAIPEVAWLDDDRPWRGRMMTAASRLRMVGLFLGALSVVAAGFVTATVVRLAAFRHRVEIEVERLAGATELYVRAPFLVAGLIQGAAAAGVAIGLLYVFWSGAWGVVGETVITDVVLGSFLSPARLTVLVVVGAMAGVVGASVALRPPREIL